jgi:hypothetical protein
MQTLSQATKHLAAALVLSLLAGTCLAQPTMTPMPQVPGVSTDGVETPKADAPAAKPATPKTYSGLESIYWSHLSTLASPEFEGRAPGTDGNRKAAAYIESKLKGWGMEPAFKSEPLPNMDGTPVVTPKDFESKPTYRQVFIAPASLRPGDSTKLKGQELAFGADSTKMQPGTDYNVIGYSASGEATGELVFTGYGIDSGPDDYSSFPAKFDLTGKIAMVMRFEPINANGKSQWAESRWSPAASLEPKFRFLQRSGASAIILVNPPGADDPRNTKLEDMSMTGNRQMKVPVIMMSQAAADKLISNASNSTQTLEALRKAADNIDGVAPGYTEFVGSKVTVKADIERIPLYTDNVGGILRGKGKLADEYIVIGSHYDHVGYGYFGSRDPNPKGKLHQGADDNASGTSGNLLVAEQIAKAYAKLPPDASARSILFLWFSAEESGLVGSRIYTQSPIAPVEKHTLMINMDMIGRLREDKLELGGVGTGEGLKDWLQPFITDSKLVVAQKNSGLGPSDHASFAGAGIPALFFFTGLHEEYHKPSDVPDTINVEGAVRVASLVQNIALAAAQSPTAWPFTTPTGKPKVSEEEEKKENQSASSPLSGVTVRFGIAPGDYSGEKEGVLIGEVLKGLPAEGAGLKAGDLMTKWDGEDLRDVEGWMTVLTKKKPGDVVKITYIRDGKEATTDAKLVGRSRVGE